MRRCPPHHHRDVSRPRPSAHPAGLVEPLEQRRLLAATVVESFSNLGDMGANPYISVSAQVPQAVTHTSVTWEGAFDAGQAVTYENTGDPWLVEGPFSYVATVSGGSGTVEGERMDNVWTRWRTGGPGWTYEHEYLYGAKYETLSYYRNEEPVWYPWWSFPHVSGTTVVTGGGSVGVSFQGSNLIEGMDWQDPYSSDGGIGMNHVTFTAHTANIWVLGMRKVNPDRGSPGDATVHGFYPGDTIEVDVRVRDDWGDPVQTSLSAVSGSYDSTIVSPGSGSTDATGFGTITVELLKHGDASFTVTTGKGGEKVVPLMVARQSITATDVTINRTAGATSGLTRVRSVGFLDGKYRLGQVTPVGLAAPATHVRSGETTRVGDDKTLADFEIFWNGPVPPAAGWSYNVEILWIAMPQDVKTTIT